MSLSRETFATFVLGISFLAPIDMLVNKQSSNDGPAVVWAAEPVRKLKSQDKPTLEPSEAQVQLAKNAFILFDNKNLVGADRMFGKAINEWERLNRPLDEVASLYKARGNVRTDLKRFDDALSDYNLVLDMMRDDGAQLPDGTARYSEFPDTYVQRGLTFEGLGDWESAINDYSKAVELWGGGRGEGINPYVLTYRGNALAFLGRYPSALEDYKAADELFTKQRDPVRAIDARANSALVMYQLGDREKAVRLMKSVLRREPGYADLHVALAADAWSRFDAEKAEQEWAFTCNNIETGCAKYRDISWVSKIRRWPPVLTQKLDNFLNKKQSPLIPAAVPQTLNVAESTK